MSWDITSGTLKLNNLQRCKKVEESQYKVEHSFVSCEDLRIMLVQIINNTDNRPKVDYAVIILTLITCTADLVKKGTLN